MRILLCICVGLCSTIAAVNGRANIDLYVAVDSKVKDVYTRAGQSVNTQHDVEYILTELNKLFERQQGVDIGVRVVKLDVLNRDLFQGVNGRVNSSVAFEGFRKYVKANHLHSQYEYDVAILFTGYNTVSEITGGNVIGHHSDDKYCDDDSVAVVPYDGTARTIFLAAGMIAGVLGVSQDSGSCEDGYIRNPKHYPGMKHQFEFSPCSIQELQAAIARDDCLKMDSPMSRIPNTKPSPDMLDMDKMCKRDNSSFMSRDASFYNVDSVAGDVICESTYCYDVASRTTYGIQTTEGLVCAAVKRCSFGKCMNAPSDFPAPSSVKDNCLFGDSPSIGDGSTRYTCPGYFQHSDRRYDCNYNWFRAQCCETCDKFGDIAKPTKHPDCAKDDPSWCHHYTRPVLCASSVRTTCCNYCVTYTPDDPIVG